MSEVIQAANEEIVTLDSREVAKMLEKEHWMVLRDIEGSKDGKTIGIIEVLRNNKLVVSDYFIESNYKTQCNNKTYPCYLITKMGCEILGNKQQGEKGILFTAKYVKRFNQMEQTLKENQPKLPTTYKEALQQLLLEVEEKEQLQIENKELKPKALFADAVSASHTSILVGELAKILKQNGVNTGQNRLFEWLRNNGYLIRRKGTDYNMPTQYSMDLELFEIKETNRVHSDGHVSIDKTVKVTGKGQIYFINKLKPVVA